LNQVFIDDLKCRKPTALARRAWASAILESLNPERIPIGAEAIGSAA
jgi:hypothetical protein